MEEKRVYCCLATRIPGPTYFFSIYRPPSLKQCARDLVPTSEPLLWKITSQVTDYNRNTRIRLKVQYKAKMELPVPGYTPLN